MHILQIHAKFRRLAQLFFDLLEFKADITIITLFIVETFKNHRNYKLINKIFI